MVPNSTAQITVFGSLMRCRQDTCECSNSRSIDVKCFVYPGMVIAVIVRDDDVEDKLVVAPEHTVLNPEQIATAVYFQEQFFSTRVIMQEPQA